MRLFFATAALQNEHLESYDVAGAYRRADSDPNFTVYMVQPPRSDGTYTVPDKVIRLDKAQKGTSDAGYRWEKHRNDTFRRFGRNVFKTEPSAYYIENHDGSNYARLLASTNDFVIFSNCIAFLAEQRDKLVQEWQITVQFPVTHLAGIKIVRTPKYIDMSAPKHIEALLGSQGMGNCKPGTCKGAYSYQNE
jgi:Reverse transcriptase (RNA-dependent DNA polymerase)